MVFYRSNENNALKSYTFNKYIIFVFITTTNPNSFYFLEKINYLKINRVWSYGARF